MSDVKKVIWSKEQEVQDINKSGAPIVCHGNFSAANLFTAGTVSGANVTSGDEPGHTHSSISVAEPLWISGATLYPARADQVISGAGLITTGLISGADFYTSGTISGATLDVLNGQIKFPATANPSADVNTLDDYEEGTWTPSVGGDATYTSQIGLYTKTGNIVTLHCQLTINVLGTGSTTTITGAPFVSTFGEATGSVAYFTSLATNIYWLSPAISIQNILFHGQTALDGSANPNLPIFGNGAAIYFTIIYPTST